MKKLLSYIGIAAAAVGLIGCRSGNANAGPMPADKLAQNDPNAKARVILDQLAAIPTEERAGWIQRRSMELTVFQTVTDPALRARYETEIAPYIGTR